jgi:hypothetical protein
MAMHSPNRIPALSLQKMHMTSSKDQDDEAATPRGQWGTFGESPDTTPRDSFGTHGDHFVKESYEDDGVATPRDQWGCNSPPPSQVSGYPARKQQGVQTEKVGKLTRGMPQKVNAHPSWARERTPSPDNYFHPYLEQNAPLKPVACKDIDDHVQNDDKDTPRGNISQGISCARSANAQHQEVLTHQKVVDRQAPTHGRQSQDHTRVPVHYFQPVLQHNAPMKEVVNMEQYVDDDSVRERYAVRDRYPRQSEEDLVSQQMPPRTATRRMDAKYAACLHTRGLTAGLSTVASQTEGDSMGTMSQKPSSTMNTAAQHLDVLPIPPQTTVSAAPHGLNVQGYQLQAPMRQPGIQDRDVQRRGSNPWLNLMPVLPEGTSQAGSSWQVPGRGTPQEPPAKPQPKTTLAISQLVDQSAPVPPPPAPLGISREGKQKLSIDALVRSSKDRPKQSITESQRRKTEARAAMQQIATDVCSMVSVGSVGHPKCCGEPCKYARKPRGCKDGVNCTRCHICKWSRRF